jgi:hypothetical protein
MRFAVYVHEVVGLEVEVDAATKAEARAKAADPSTWIEWAEVPEVLRVWVPREEAARMLGEELDSEPVATPVEGSRPAPEGDDQ